LPKGNTAQGGSFRGIGEGVYTAAPTIEQILVEAFYFDVQLEVDEALLKGQKASNPEDVLSLQTRLQVQQNAIELGRQFYVGTALDNKGFYGIQQMVDTTMTAVKGSATGGSTESVYLIRNTLDGVHFVYGNGTGLQQGQWIRQRLTKSSKHYFAMVNNVSGYIGLANNHPMSICRIPNLDDSGTSGKFITDKMIAQAISLFPVGFGPTHILMSRRQRYWLQQSRTVVAQGNLNNTLTGWPGVPKDSNDIQIVVTDSITLTETAI
jgi:hypothetical protein